MPTYSSLVDLPVSVDEAFAWHERPAAFLRLIPPGTGIRVLSQQGTIHNGDNVRLSFRLPSVNLRMRWQAAFSNYLHNAQFCDVQQRGPFAQWIHTHRFRATIAPDGAAIGSTLEDRIEYRLPGGWAGQRLFAHMVDRHITRVFAFRHRRTLADLIRHQRFHAGGRPPLRVVISGTNGLVGKALRIFLESGGHRTQALVRSANPQAPHHRDDVPWDPQSGRFDEKELSGCDAMVHLAGSNIADGRWTTQQRQRIRSSRIEPTYRLCLAVASLPQPPKVLVVASGIGYYGDQGDQVLDEHSPIGRGFLAEVCKDWEEATLPARAAGIRVVNLRIGMVLAEGGGVLQRMLPAFRYGAGGILGTGRQWLSWISLDDLLGVIYHALGTNGLSGVVNACSPQPVTNRQFTACLARILHRPALLPLPAGLIRLVLGDMGSELILTSTRALPNALIDSGFQFNDADLETAVRRVLGREVLPGPTR